MIYNVFVFIKEYWYYCVVMIMLYYDGVVKKKKKYLYKLINLEFLVLFLVRVEYEVYILILNVIFLFDGMFILLIYKVFYVIGYNF